VVTVGPCGAIRRWRYVHASGIAWCPRTAPGPCPYPDGVTVEGRCAVDEEAESDAAS
jgi:hypothetical protein